MFPLLPRNPHQIRRTWDKLLAVAAFFGVCAFEFSTADCRGAEPPPAIADFALSYQTIDNFSASDAWSMQHVGLWADPNRKQVADLLFSTNNGIGLSAWRFNLMAGFDPTVSPGTLWQLWRSGNGFMTTPNRFDWDRQPGQRWFLAAAKGRGIDQFIAMVYSPPTNYTRNGKVYCTDGQGTSNLKPGYEVAFSQYMSDILVHFKTNAVESERVDINYIMPVNEPIWEWNGNSQEGSRYSNAGLIALAKALRNALDARGLKSEILLSETGDIPSLYSLRADISTKYKADYGNYISALNGITNVISRNLTAHSYWTDNPTNELVEVRQRLKAELSANPHWRYWQSEYCVMGPAGPGRDLTMKTALNVARVMWADLAIADAAAWHWWLSISQANYKDGLLYTDFWKTGDTETLYCSKNFWAFGQWSRFIRPGWKRITLPGYDDVFGLMGAAFTDPANTKIAMVFVNHASAGKVIKPSVSNLPGKRVTHWAPYITSAVASDNLSAMPPVAPETELLIPAESVVTLVGNITDGSSAVPVIAGLSDMSARAGETLSVKLSVTDSDTPAGLVQLAAYAGDSPVVGQSAISIQREYVTNALTRELFVDFSGEGLAKLAAAPRFPASPHARHSVPWFEAPQNVTGKHGTRLLGYVVPPQTGNYTFWIASRDASELYLSTDENPGKKRMIAWVNGYTAPREWTWEPNQQSTHVQLEAGKRYYVEAFQTAVAGGGHLSVGWQLPDQTLERPIPGSRLSPWIDPFTNSAQHVLTIKCPTNSSGRASIAVVATDASGAASTNSFNLTIEPEQYRILAIGDSITVGYTDNPTWAAPFEFGYRSELFNILKDSGVRVQFVGSSVEPWNGLWKVPTNQPSPDLRKLGQDAHEGYGAKATAFVEEHIEGWVRTNQPDIILLMIGINDIRAGSTNAPDSAKSNLWRIVQTVQQTKPNTRMFVAKTIPYTRPTPAILDLNSFIGDELVPTFKSRGFRVTVVDQFSNFVKEPGATAGDPSLYSNGYNHPNAQGYRLMAEAWARAISQELGKPNTSAKRQ